jgi:UDP:flavonoid glycosyltransferase YjiC (YdhE family)
MCKKVCFIGPSIPVDCDAFLESPREVSDVRKTVFVTWGTMQAGVPAVFIEVMEALLEWENVNVVAAGGRSDDCRYVPRGVSIVHGTDNFYAQLAGSDVFVTNGGFGGVKGALYFGVPVVCFGTQDDKREVCQRVASARAGSSLAGKRGGVGAHDVLAEVRRVLGESQFSSSACAVAEELRQYERSDRAADRIDELLSS